jgi:CRISPR-associated exonuclease Cas4
MNRKTGDGFGEEDLLPLGALADVVFCERRACLHLLEGLWQDNVFTARGTLTHERVHSLSGTEPRGNLHVARGLLISSSKLGISGKADVVEFYRLKIDPHVLHEAKETGLGFRLPGEKGFWQAYPVEYKGGHFRSNRSFEVQVCAQAICLEEMLGVAVPVGAIFFGKQRRRLEVMFDEQLRNETEVAAIRLHELVRSGKTPVRQYEKKCQKCSMLSLCMPKTTGSNRSVRSYLARALVDNEEA